MPTISEKHITVVTRHLPKDAGSGSHIRIGATVRALKIRRKVRVILITSPDETPSTDDLSQLATLGVECSTFPESELVSAGRWLCLIADFAALLSPRVSNRMLPRFGLSAIDENAGDLWFFKTKLLAGRRLPTRGRVVVDLDDLEERTIRTRMTVSHLLHRIHLIAHRKRALAIAGVSLVCSAQDRQRLRKHTNIDVLPNTYLLPESLSPIPTTSHDLVVAMIGRMGYLPNREGAEWFATECWPLIRSQVPNAECQLSGGSANILEHLAGNGIAIRANLPDAIEFLRGVTVSVVPIHRGSGTRIKILEAMALGIPVVSTTIGAEGLDVTDGTNIFLRDTPEAFASAVAQLLADPMLAREIGLNGNALFDSIYRFDRFQDRVDRIFNDWD